MKIVLSVLILVLMALISLIYFRSSGIVFAQPSQATLSFKNNEFKLEFKHLETKDISIKFEPSTAVALENIFKNNHLLDENKSMNLNLKISSKEIDFDNKKTFGPFEGSEDLLENSSTIGTFKMQTLGDQGYLIEIDNPEQVISEATLSGKLKLSDKLLDLEWWQLLSKLARIKLKIVDGSLSGSIFLK